MDAPSSTCTTNDFISVKFGSVSDPTYMFNMYANGVNFDLSTDIPKMINKPAPKDAKVTCLYINPDKAKNQKCNVSITDFSGSVFEMNEQYNITIPPLHTIRKITSSCQKEPEKTIDGTSLGIIFGVAIGLSAIIGIGKYFWDKRANARLLAEINAQEGTTKGGYFSIGE